MHDDPARWPVAAAAQQLASLPAIYDAVPVGLCLVDQDLRVVSLNRRMAEMTGRPAEANIGHSLAEVVPGLAEQLGPQLRRVLGGERVADLELCGDHAGALYEGRVFLASLEPLPGEDGTVAGVLCSTLDVTERKRAEAALRESEDHYRHTVELSPHIPWTADPDGLVLEVSPRWLAFTGTIEAAGEGWAKAVHPEDRPETMAAWSYSRENGKPFDFDCRLRLADGNYRWVRSRAAPRRDAEGRILRWYGIVEDVHDRKLAVAALRESERGAREQAAWIETVYASAPVGLAFHDCNLRLLAINDRLLAINDQLAAINGYSVAAMIGRTPSEVFDPAFAEVLEAPLRQVIETGLPVEGVEIHAVTPSMPGVERDFLASYHPVRSNDGSILGVSVAVLEITERKRTEASLRESEEFARSVVESSLDCIMVLDLEGRLLFINGPGRRLIEIRDFRSVQGRDWCSLLPFEGEVEARRAVTAARAARPTHFAAFCPTAKGTPKWWDIMVSPIFGAKGEVVRLLSTGRDITERRHAEQQIAYLAHHDPLTGLANRLLFRQQLEQALAGAGRSGRMAVHCLDLDQFKGVNDTLGHPTGDALLRQVAERLRGCVRESDTIARLGGDEFVIVQTKLRSPEDAANLAQRVIEALGEAYDLDGQQVTVGASVGIALTPDHGTTPDEIIKNADIALYRAKADGRGTFCFFTFEMDEFVRLKQELKTGLHTALIRDELELHFQPLVELRSGEVTCFEALLRWRRPIQGLVSPVDFIPMAEESGMIVPLGEWALRAACREAVHWPHPIRVAVNLSPVQFRSHDLLRAVTGALAESGLAAERLELEITETVLLRDDNLAILHQLRGLGIRIALDDFGTGYSALGYLRRFPFGKIKIDRSFVTDLPDREESNAIVRAIISLGRSLGIAVAAEGVETARQLEALRSEGCGEAQGYFFSRPVPAGEVLAVISRLQRAGNPVA